MPAPKPTIAIQMHCVRTLKGPMFVAVSMDMKETAKTVQVSESSEIDLMITFKWNFLLVAPRFFPFLQC